MYTLISTLTFYRKDRINGRIALAVNVIQTTHETEDGVTETKRVLEKPYREMCNNFMTRYEAHTGACVDINHVVLTK
jgi:hypothetical protein